MAVGKRNGPRIELMVRCGGCKNLGTRTSYGSNDYEETNYVCESGPDGRAAPLPHGADQTPKWCPLMPVGLGEWQDAVKQLATP